MAWNDLVRSHAVLDLTKVQDMGNFFRLQIPHVAGTVYRRSDVVGSAQQGWQVCGQNCASPTRVSLDTCNEKRWE